MQIFSVIYLKYIFENFLLLEPNQREETTFFFREKKR